jgi:Fic family protein
MWKEGPNGFEGGMNARKYVSIATTSKATATRDLQDLAEKKIFIPTGGGRSTRYVLNLSDGSGETAL